MLGIDINTYDPMSRGFRALTNLGDTAPSSYDPFPGCTTGQFAGFEPDAPFGSVIRSSLGRLSYTTYAPEPDHRSDIRDVEAIVH